MIIPTIATDKRALIEKNSPTNNKEKGIFISAAIAMSSWVTLVLNGQLASGAVQLGGGV
jgi:hypothetical protein